MDEGEKRLKQEDCSEDSLGSGILTLTNKRLAFDKTQRQEPMHLLHNHTLYLRKP